MAGLMRPTAVNDMLPRVPRVVRDYVEELEGELGRTIPSHLFPDGPPPPQPADDHDRHDVPKLGRFARGSATSRKAALDNYPRSGKQRHTVLMALVDAGERGLTSDEIAGMHRMNLYSVKPRLIELREGGWATQNGKQRKSEQGSDVDVYVATDKAHTETRKRRTA